MNLPRKPVGIDLDPMVIDQARQTGYYSELFTCNACQLPFAADTFALVFSNSSLEHVRGVVAALSEVRRVLKPGGILAFTVPTARFGQSLLRPRLLRMLRMRSQAEDAQEHILSDTDTYNRLTLDQWCELVLETGLRIVKSETFMPPPSIWLWESLHYIYTKPLVGVRLADLASRARGFHRVAMHLALQSAVHKGKQSSDGTQVAVAAMKPVHTA
jgi:SAM-dependent methyltransferase